MSRLLGDDGDLGDLASRRRRPSPRSPRPRRTGPAGRRRSRRSRRRGSRPTACAARRRPGSCEYGAWALRMTASARELLGQQRRAARRAAGRRRSRRHDRVVGDPSSSRRRATSSSSRLRSESRPRRPRARRSDPRPSTSSRWMRTFSLEQQARRLSTTTSVPRAASSASGARPGPRPRRGGRLLVRASLASGRS